VKSLGEDVGSVVSRSNILRIDLTAFGTLANKEILNVDMFGSRVKNGISEAKTPRLSTNKGVGALESVSPIAANNDRNQIASLVAPDEAINSASVVDSATVGCFLLCHEMATPASLKTGGRLPVAIAIACPIRVDKALDPLQLIASPAILQSQPDSPSQVAYPS
jgi:hypothetical protein